jgi:AAA domain, putative AbiEii toxin, Type IV TA system
VISSIEAQNFKGFRDVKLSGLGPFHALAGKNGSGKSSLFEILEFVKDLLLFDVQEAVSRRHVSSLRDLTYDRLGGSVSFDITLDKRLFDGKPVRYRLEIEESDDSGAAIVSEVLLKDSSKLVWRIGDHPVLYAREDESEDDYFSFPWARSANSQVPPDTQRYPTANFVKKLLTTGIQSLSLDSRLMGTPCPPSLSATELLRDGKNLARVAGRLLKAGGEEWIYHLRLALEDLERISWHQQESDRAEYLALHYRDGLKIPSWLASFGTLRTLALTLPAFLPADEPRLYLFEEPENGIHPKAIEIVMSAIQSIPYAQTFVTTHSPMIVQQSGVDSLLLFSKRDKEIVVEHGGDNAILRDLDGVPDLATVFASRVLG